MPSRRELEIRNQINHIFLTASDEEMFKGVLDLILNAIPSKNGMFSYFDENGKFKIPAATGYTQIPADQELNPLEIPSSVLRKAVEAKAALFDNVGPFSTPRGHVPLLNTLIATIIYHHRVIGLISLGNKDGGYGEEDKGLLETITRIVAPVLDGRLEWRKQDLTILNEIADLVNQSLELNKVLDIALQKTRDLFGAEGGVIYLFDDLRESLQPRACHNLSREMIEEISALKRQGLSASVAITGEPVVSPDLRADARNRSVMAVRDDWRSYAAAPIKSKGKFSGIIVILSGEVNFFNPDALATLVHIGIQIGPSIENARLFEELQKELLSHKQTAEKLQKMRTDLEKYFSKSIDLLCFADIRGFFRRLNPEWGKTLGYPLSELEGKRFLDFVHPDDIESTLDAMKDLASGKNVINFVNRYRHSDGNYLYIEWRSYAAGDVVYAVARNISERKRLEQERESLIAELEKALSDVKKLSGLLPICASCKKIRDDKGYWNQIESYISEHSEADFSHGICPDCAKSSIRNFTLKIGID